MTPSSIIQSRYRIERLLGSGGFARVYLAQDERLGRPVAVKELYSTSLDAQEQQAALGLFEREARMLAQLDHTGLTNIWDYFQEDGRAYLVMEYVAGPTLRDLVLNHGAALPTPLVVACGIELCDVLAYLHARTPPVIFRDLKPGNVIVEELPDGEPTTVEHLTPDNLSLKLIDFGIARLFKPEQSTDTMIIGTPGYASPEQYGQGQTDVRSDIYSLGATLHHLASGVPPSGLILPSLLEVAPNASPALDRVIARATSFKPQDRYQTIELLRRDLLALSEAPQRTVPHPPRTPRPTVPLAPSVPLPAPSRGPSPLFLTVILLVLLGLIGLGAVAVRAFGDGETDTATTSEDSGETQPAQGATSLLQGATGRLLYSECTDVRTSCDIYLTDVAGGTRSLVVGEGSNTAAALSPDGELVAVSQNGAIFVGPLDDPTARQVSSNTETARYPAFSPDGRLLAYSATLNGDAQLAVTDLQTGQTRLLTTNPSQIGWITWSEQGLTYAAAERGQAQDIFVLDDLNGTPRNLTNTPDIEEDFPAWSPDGRSFVFTASPAPSTETNLNQRQIFRADADGSDRVRLTEGPGPHTSPAWSPDGRWIGYVSRAGGGAYQIWAVQVEGGEQRQLSQGGPTKFYLHWAE